LYINNSYINKGHILNCLQCVIITLYLITRQVRTTLYVCISRCTSILLYVLVVSSDLQIEFPAATHSVVLLVTLLFKPL